ncbi:MAG TPA: PEP-CTERM sorting domain-containing protein [Tepidisphaeraceae bacterium]|nr:PEP-CTERM sorting domain-containing protein [Tepidisphaeraceae bacterium]
MSIGSDSHRALPASSPSLRSYVAVAGSLLAGSTATHAAIEYSGPQNLEVFQGNSLQIDIDFDGFFDARFKNYIFGGGNYMGGTVNFAPGQFVGFTSGLAYVSNLAPGSIIGPGSVGPTFFGSMAYGAANPNAQFNNATDAFLGMSFPSGPDTFYGWVRVSINQPAGTFFIKDWAYDNEGAAIAAGAVPEPASLGLLALGAAGLAAYRRR